MGTKTQLKKWRRLKKAEAEEADRATLAKLMKSLVGHTYSCKNYQAKAGTNSMMLLDMAGVVINQSVTFTSSTKAKLSCTVNLTTAEARRSPACQAVKSTEAAYNGVMTLGMYEGYICLYDSNNEIRASFKIVNASKIKDVHGVIFTKVR